MKNKKIIEPEVLKPEDKVLVKKSDIERQPQQNTFRPSSISFFNKLKSIKLKFALSYQKDYQEYLGNMAEHAKAFDRLMNVDEEIQVERLKRRRAIEEEEDRLRALRREAKFAADDDDIAGLRRKAEKEELLQRIERIKGGRISKIAGLKEELKEKLIKKEVLDGYELDKLRLKIKRDLKKELEIDKIFNEVYDEHFQGKTPEDYTEDDRRIHERFLELFESAQDKE